LLALKNLDNALEKLEVHIPDAKQKLEAIQAKYETGQTEQKISKDDDKVCMFYIGINLKLYV